MNRFVGLFVTAFLLAIIAPLPLHADGEGMTPAMAIELGSDEVTGTVKSSVYYSFSASGSGIMDVALTPQSGEVDLTVVHFSGSPAIESRREGMAVEDVSLRVSRGDKFLIRVISPFGKAASYRLKVGVDAAPGRNRKEDLFMPDRTRDGKAESSAVEVPLGRTVPVEAMGERYFRTHVPAGYVLSVTLYPIHGDADLAIGSRPGRDAWSVSSHRRGLLAEHLYLPVDAERDVMIRVNPAPANEQLFLRYAIVARIHQPGIDSLTAAPDLEMDPRSSSSDIMDEPLGIGLPGRMEPSGQGSSKILRLP